MSMFNRVEKRIDFNWYGYHVRAVHHADSTVDVYLVRDDDSLYHLLFLGLRPKLPDWALKASVLDYLNHNYLPHKLPVDEHPEKRRYNDL